MSDEPDTDGDPGREDPHPNPDSEPDAESEASTPADPDKTIDGWDPEESSGAPRPSDSATGSGQLHRTLAPEDLEKLFGPDGMDQTLAPEDIQRLLDSGALGEDITPEEVARMVSSGELSGDASDLTLDLGTRPPVPAAGKTAQDAALEEVTHRPSSASNPWDVTLAAQSGSLDPQLSMHAPTVPLQRMADSIGLDLRPGAVSLRDMTGSVGEYVDAKPLARGGMGVIYAASQARLRRGVAIKVMIEQKGPAKARLNAERQFIAEALVTGKLEHPNIVPVHDLGRTAEGQLYLSMKLVQGETLEELLQREPAITPERISRHVDILIDICDGLDFAHSQGVVHQDLKPANIMIGQFGEVQIMDWGLAFEVDPAGRSIGLENAMPSGTPCYLAPEQARGDGPSWGTHTDVFLLGAMLYYALTGTPPHQGKQVRDFILAALDGVHQRPSERAPDRLIPADLEDLCMRAMALEPADRVPSAAAFRDALRAHREHREATKLLDRSEAILGTHQKGVEFAERAAELGRASMLCAQARELWPESDRLGTLESEVLAAQAKNALELRRPARVFELLEGQEETKEVNALLASARRMQTQQRREKLHARIRTVASIVVVVALIGVGYWASRPRPDGRFEADAVLARSKADTEHPMYEKAEIAIERARLAFDQQRWDDAYSLFADAKDKYAQCETWDDSHARRAADARQRAEQRNQHPKILELAASVAENAESERRKGHYSDAYDQYKRAESLLDTDLSVYLEVDRLKAEAVEHPLLERARELEEEANRLLDASSAGGVRLDAARTSFQQAADLLRLCQPWEEHHEAEVAEAKAKADASRTAEVQRAEALEVEAEGLRQKGDYAQAYARLKSARDLYRDIETNYDQTQEDAALAMKKIADPGVSELFAQAEDLMTQARAAKTRKEHEQAYALFARARAAYRETRPFDEQVRTLAQAERDNADDRLPDYQEGERLLELAEQHVTSLDYERAAQLFANARGAYYRARAYDPRPEERALAAKADANERVKTSWREAEEALASGVEARDRLAFQEAESAFKSAEKSYKLCVFPDEVYDTAVDLYSRVDERLNVDMYALASDKYEEAKELVRSDGPAAKGAFEAAAAAFQRCLELEQSTVQEITVAPLEPPEVELAVVAAKNRRDTAADLKNSRDEWNASNKMHRKSVASYRSAGEFYDAGRAKIEQALALRKQARREGEKSMFPEVISLADAAAAEFDKAIDDYSRVVQKGR